ncbi:hypothetical protein LVD15_11905 [Fulvivirga maritima]|uniref:hypothetical protein n=1 Tax=Fulvivirga maritima TaxID=2904247 RepID=UPI001F32174A|nr:hypothetical protein [Fulvivirga maritima]UII29100.1 hypothetical protein LVD15_11905 [Fulvivirga maritima]
MKKLYSCCLAQLCLWCSRLFSFNHSLTHKPILLRKWLLVRTSTLDRIGTLGGRPHSSLGPYAVVLRNAPMTDLIRYLNEYYNDQGIIIEDATCYAQPIDIILPTRHDGLARVREVLHIYDLDLLEAIPLQQEVISHHNECLT